MYLNAVATRFTPSAFFCLFLQLYISMVSLFKPSFAWPLGRYFMTQACVARCTYASQARIYHLFRRECNVRRMPCSCDRKSDTYSQILSPFFFGPFEDSWIHAPASYRASSVRKKEPYSPACIYIGRHEQHVICIWTLFDVLVYVARNQRWERSRRLPYDVQ